MMTDTQFIGCLVLIFGVSSTYWAWSISNTLMDILGVLKEKR